MARQTKSHGRSKQVPVNLQLKDFKGGLVTLVDESLLPPNAVKECTNLIQTQDGRWSTRWGSAYYGNAWGGTLVGAARYVASDNTVHLVALVDTGSSVIVQRSTDNGTTIETCTGATFTRNKKPFFKQINNYLYISDSFDALVRYQGTNILATFTALSTPAAPSLARTVLIAGSYNLYYKITAVNTVGETAASSEASISVNKQRNSWKDDGTEFITLTITRVTNAVRYNLYFSDESGAEVYMDSIADPGSGTTLTYDDRGVAPLADTVIAPPLDTTTGPKFGPMELSGNRLWGTIDRNNPWRVHWSGTTPAPGSFSLFYGGSYIDLEIGGAERPYSVVHYRDGKGGNFATVLTSDPEGNGSIWQIDLTEVTVGNYSYTQPVAVKIVGSVGTIAPLSVVKMRNDIGFFNSKGMFTLASKAQMLNLLSTDEISANIRPNMRNLTPSALSKVASYYYDAKVFWSVPEAGSTVNNAIYINDLERRNWAGPWTFGVERFFEYADTSGATHLLAVPTNGTKLLEISPTIQGDLGAAFATTLTTGLIPIAEDRTAFAKIRRGYVELNQPVGPIRFTILANQKKKPFQGVGDVVITDEVSTTGFDTSSYVFDQLIFDDTSQVPHTFSRSTLHKWARVNRLVNNIQFQLTTFELRASYTLLTFQGKGFIVPTRDPVDWGT